MCVGGRGRGGGTRVILWYESGTCHIIASFCCYTCIYYIYISKPSQSHFAAVCSLFFILNKVLLIKLK